MTRASWLWGVAAVAAASGAAVSWPRHASPAVAVTVADGAQLFRAKGCASCHDGPDTTAPFGEFPALGDAATWAATRQPGQSAHDYLWDSIRLPQAVIAPGFRPDGGPTNEMPTLQLSDTEIDAVVRYLLGPGG